MEVVNIKADELEKLQVAKSKVGLVLGLPMGRDVVRREWALALTSISWPMNLSIMQSVVVDHPISDARNFICEQALAVEAPYIWFIDDDTIPPSAGARMLMYALDQHPEAAVIGGIYCSKTEPTQPVVFKEFGTGSHWDWKVGEVFECAGIGTGCMLIRTAVLKEIERPWFSTLDVALIGSEYNQIQQTDDMYFCKKLKQGGHKILAHGGVLCHHWDMSTGKMYSLPKDSRPYQDTKGDLIV